MDVSVFRPNFNEATVKWSFKTKTTSKPWSVLFLEVTNTTTSSEYTFLVELKSGIDAVNEFVLPKEIICAGNEYVVKLKKTEMFVFGKSESEEKDDQEFSGIVGHKLTAVPAEVKFRAEFTEGNLQTLMTKALNFPQTSAEFPFQECRYFYRNKPPVYYEEIRMWNKNVMKVYRKDQNGDPASIINGKIDGLFFAVNVDKDNNLPAFSPFGGQRLHIPAHIMFRRAPNMYFADFYCINSAHYVTLVMTRTNSEADKFCKDKKLLVLDINDNPFLFQRQEDMAVFVTSEVLVEVLFTENVDLNATFMQGAFFRIIRALGTSKPAGYPKNPACPHCNLD